MCSYFIFFFSPNKPKKPLSFLAAKWHWSCVNEAALGMAQWPHSRWWVQCSTKPVLELKGCFFVCLRIQKNCIACDNKPYCFAFSCLLYMHIMITMGREVVEDEGLVVVREGMGSFCLSFCTNIHPKLCCKEHLLRFWHYNLLLWLFRCWTDFHGQKLGINGYIC